ncbi:MAG: DUF1624 domain-containing protein [Sandaracinaceae bacterium]|nr:DUF1624 domain-containing protein [Sandaracinaceae bacterium]
MSRAVADVSITGPHSTVEEEAEVRPVVVAKAPRWLALDVFRFFAVLMMVQGHVFTTLLDSTTKAQGWYAHHSAFHGFTAPMFLFGAGLAFGYTTFRKWDAHTAGGAAALKRYKRYAWLLVLGYGLQLPTLSLRGLLSIDDPEALSQLLQVNVLQHIGVSLAIVQLLVGLVKRQRVVIAILAVLTAICVFAAPWIWAIDVSGLPIVLQGYVNQAGHSWFPLVPWAGFTYSGIILAWLLGLRGSTESISGRMAWPFLALALLFMIVPVVIDRFGPFPWPPHNFWKTNPLFFFWRFGNVLLVLSALCFAERYAAARGWLDPDYGSRVLAAILPWVKLLAAESLVIYVAHLLVLHGSVLAPGLTSSGTVASHEHGVLVAALWTLAIMGAMVVISKAWAELRKQSKAFTVVQLTIVGVIVLLSLTR